jgi:TonB family protein
MEKQLTHTSSEENETADAWKQWEGQVIDGEFPLHQYLGGSDHSAVFLTQYAGQEVQKAVIKLMPTQAGDWRPQILQHSLEAALSHPHLLRLFHAGRARVGEVELLYVVMEYAEENLSQILAIRPLAPEETRAMLLPVLDALSYIHLQGLAHGHLKPANITAVNDQVKVASDGLYKEGESGNGRLEPSHYDPPEISSAGITSAGDVWSLGIILVEAVTQSVPTWNGTEQRELELPATMPAPFRDIALHCLNADAEGRWTISDIRARLERESAIPAPQRTALPERASAGRKYLIPTVAAVLALAVLGGVKLLTRPRPEAGAIRATATEEPAVRPTPKSSAASPQAPEKMPSPNVAEKSEQNSSAVVAPHRAATIPHDGVNGAGQREVVEQVVPDVSPSARATIRGTVRVNVRVRVDASGKVAGATLDSPGPSRYFAGLALRAAQRWRFAPAPSDVPRQWVLRFEFSRFGTKAIPQQASSQVNPKR